jgi:hypothetical protein
MNLSVLDIPEAITLVSPADGATDQSTLPTFAWQADAMASTYTLEVATDAAFTNIVVTETGIAGTSHTLTTALEGDVTYYWRVRGTGTCGVGSNSAVYSFTTLASSPIYLPAVFFQTE